jgi:hypothetical protein
MPQGKAQRYPPDNQYRKRPDGVAGKRAHGVPRHGQHKYREHRYGKQFYTAVKPVHRRILIREFVYMCMMHLCA